MLRFLTDSVAARATFVIVAGVALVVGIGLLQDPDPTNDRIVLQLLEKTVLILTTVAAVYLLLHASSRQATQLALFRSMLQTHGKSAAWRAKVIDVMAALGIAIDRQFGHWDLSTPEREVAMLLLKGLDCADIALLHDCSERAIRRQAALIYRKAGLDGHVAFSTYFLDDLQPITASGS